LKIKKERMIKMIERKYMAHFIDANFGVTSVSNYRLGKDVEEYNIELNGDVTKKKNILGEPSVVHNGYEPSVSLDTFYPDYDDVLSEKLFAIANERLTGNGVRTTVVDVLLDATGAVEWAYREEVVIDVKSVGGAEALNTPFDIHYAGNRVKGTFVMSTKVFTPDAA
jgi:hypothetical protein